MAHIVGQEGVSHVCVTVLGRSEGMVPLRKCASTLAQNKVPALRRCERCDPSYGSIKAGGIYSFA